MATKLKAIVFMGSARDGRMCDRVTKFVTSKLTEAKYDVEVWDPLELKLPLVKQPLQFFPDPSQAPQQLRDMNDKIKAADAFIVVTAEYNRQMPPGLTNIIDYFPPTSFAFRPSAIVCYSLGGGGFSAAMQARTLMVEMGASPIPYVWHIPTVMKSLDESGNVLNEYLHKQASKMMMQLDWYAHALKSHREKVGFPKWEGTTVSA